MKSWMEVKINNGIYTWGETQSRKWEENRKADNQKTKKGKKEKGDSREEKQ